MVIVVGAAHVAAQDRTASPDEIWSFEPDNGAAVNDIAISQDGDLVGAALDEGPRLGADEGEVCAWFLADDDDDPRSPWNSCASTSAGFLSDQSMNTIAVQPRSDTDDAFVAASGDQAVHVWSLSAGTGSDQTATYENADDEPSGDVEDLTFLSETQLLAWHADELSLLEHDGGTQFNEAENGRWSPDDGNLVDVAISGDRERILALSADTSVSTADLHLYVIEVSDDGALELNAHETQSDRGEDGLIATDDTGEFAVLGTDAGWVFYYQIQPADDEDAEHDLAFSPSPYSAETAPVAALGMGTHGIHFAVGDTDGDVTFFEQTTVEEDGPRASPLGTVDVRSSPSKVSFVDEGHQIYVIAEGLYAFHANQFEQERLSPLWTMPGYGQAEIAQDGQRLIATDGSTVDTYRQSYAANVSLEGPDEIQPGQASTFTVTIANAGSLFDTYQLEVTGLPTAWTTSFNLTEVPLLPGEQTQAAVNLTPHAQQTPEDVTFTVEARSQAAPTETTAGQGSFTVAVQEIRRAAISVPSERMEVQQGEAATLEATLENAGNTDTTLELNVQQADDWSVLIEDEPGSAAEVDLEAGEQATLNVTLEVPTDAAQGSTNEITLDAQPTGQGDGDEAQITLIVDPTYSASLSGPEDTLNVEPGDEETFTVTVQNSGNTDDSYALIPYSNATNPEHLWRVSLDPTNLDVDAEGSSTVDVSVTVPAGAERQEATDVTLVLRSTTTGDKLDEDTYTLEVPEETEDAPLPFVAPLALIAVALARRRQR